MPNITEAKCVLIIGATAGIGRALALAIHDLPTKPTVIVGGRRQERIDELTKSSGRIKGVQIDVQSGRQVLKTFVSDIIANYPDVRLPILTVSLPLTSLSARRRRILVRNSTPLRFYQTGRTELGP